MLQAHTQPHNLTRNGIVSAVSAHIPALHVTPHVSRLGAVPGSLYLSVLTKSTLNNLREKDLALRSCWPATE